MNPELPLTPFPDPPSAKDQGKAFLLLAATAAVTAFMLWLVNVSIDGCNWHPALQFGGSSQAIVDAVEPHCRDLAEQRIHTTLALDSILALTYGIGGFLILKAFVPVWRDPAPHRLSSFVVWFPMGAMALDLIENRLALGWLRSSSRGVGTFEWLPLLMTTTAWAKWALVAASAVFAMVAGLAFFTGNRAWREPRGAAGAQTEGTFIPFRGAVSGEGLAVCFSGGGIRSAGYSLGVLAGLEEAKLISEVQRLSAVSGGAYAATSWRLWKQEQPTEKVAQKIIDALLQNASEGAKVVAGAPDGGSEHGPTSSGDSLDPARVRTRWGKHRYLWNTGSGVIGTIAWGVICVGFGVLVLAAVILVVGWPLGRLLGSWIVLGSDGLSRGAPGTLSLAPRQWFPSATFLVLGFIALSASIRSRRALSLGLAALGLSVSLLVLLIALPWALLNFGYVLVDGGAFKALWLVGAGLASGAVGFVGRMIIGPLGKLLPRLGGVLLTLVVVILVFYVAAEAAFEGPIDVSAVGTWPLWYQALIALEVLLIIYLGFDMEWVSLRRLYRDRLDLAFSPGGNPSEVKWSQLLDRPELPELLICSALHHSGFARVGSPTTSFTVSPSAVQQGVNEVAWTKYAPTLTTDQQLVVAWMPITGAAFASAMGTRGVGTTGALMAALNIDLGAWLPNVAAVNCGYNRFPPTRLGYLIKEAFGLYSDETDDRVFVADGGHWENLGLVELLRRRHTRIVCADASGDKPRTYEALREAITLARAELEDDFMIDLSPLEEDQRMALGDAKSSAIGLPFVLRPEGEKAICGWIWYAKLQVADDHWKWIRRFTRTDRHFPNYSTMNQLLDDHQFAYLTLAGKQAGQACAVLDQAKRTELSPWHLEMTTDSRSGAARRAAPRRKRAQPKVSADSTS